MRALVATTAGCFSVDLESEEIEPASRFEPDVGPPLNLPRVIASAQSGSTVVALVDARPSLLISHDAAQTWRDAGRGLPTGRAIAIAATDPDTILYAGRNRLFLSSDGGLFWHALPIELPEITQIALRES